MQLSREALPQQLLNADVQISREQLNKVLENILMAHGSRLLSVPCAATAASLSPADRWIAFLRPYYTLMHQIGAGGQAAVFCARPTTTTAPSPVVAPTTPPFVAIKITDRFQLLKEGSRAAARIKHFAVELAALRLVPAHENLGHCLEQNRHSLFHTPCGKIFVVMNLVAPVQEPSVAGRLAHFLAVRKPSRLGDFDQILSQWKTAAAAAAAAATQQQRQHPDQQEQQQSEEAILADLVNRNNLFGKLADDLQLPVAATRSSHHDHHHHQSAPASSSSTNRYCRGEVPCSGTLYHYVLACKRLHVAYATTITRQTLQAVSHLHSHNLVHRDIKPENVVVKIERRLVELKRDAETQRVVGAKFEETVQAVLIDFGLSKYLLEQRQEEQEQVSKTAAAAVAAANSASFAASAPKSPGAELKQQARGDDDDDDDGDVFANVADDAVDGVAVMSVQQIQQRDAEKQQKKPEQQPNDKKCLSTSSNRLSPQPSNSSNATFGKATTSPAMFSVALTPVGTSLYLSLEAAQGALQCSSNKVPRWFSTNRSVLKLDVHGVGQCCYFAFCGAPAIGSLPKSYRPVSHEQKMKQIEELISAGPSVFPQFVSRVARDFICSLLENAVEKRSSVRQALENSFISHASNVIVSEYGINGVISVRGISAPAAHVTSVSALSAAAPTIVVTDAVPDAAAALRREEEGEEKSPAAATAAAAAEANKQPLSSSSSTSSMLIPRRSSSSSSSRNKSGSGSGFVVGVSRSSGNLLGSADRKHQQQQQQQQRPQVLHQQQPRSRRPSQLRGDENEDVLALILEHRRAKEDEGDFEGKS